MQRSEVDLNGSLWYTARRGYLQICMVLKLTSTGHYGILMLAMPVAQVRSEVDLNGSLWYMITWYNARAFVVLKLTSTGHYGIFWPCVAVRLLWF